MSEFRGFLETSIQAVFLPSTLPRNVEGFFVFTPFLFVPI